MKIKSRNLLTAILALLCAVTVALGVSFALPKNEIKSASASGEISEIWNGKSFNKSELKNLYVSLTGKPNASLQDVINLAQTPQNSANLRKNNGESDIIVTIAGIRWSAVYLTLSREGDVALTLWSMESSDSAVQFNNYATNVDGNTPANMYGTSYIRAEALNIGGGYANSYNDDYHNLTGQATKKHTVSENKWAKFTSDQCTGNLTDFILTPREIAYQET